MKRKKKMPMRMRMLRTLIKKTMPMRMRMLRTLRKKKTSLNPNLYQMKKTLDTMKPISCSVKMK